MKGKRKHPLAVWRYERGISQKELATALNKQSDLTVDRWEAGVAMPKINDLVSLYAFSEGEIDANMFMHYLIMKEEE